MSVARELVPLTAIYAIAFFFTRPYFMGDTASYAIAVLNQERGRFHSFPNNFWDFGHVLWRPLGWIVHQGFTRYFLYTTPGEELLSICAGLIAVSAAAGLVSVLLLHSLAGRFVKGIARWLISLLFLSFYAFLNYVHSGSAYVPGLMCTMLGLWLLVRAVERGKPRPLDAILSGAALAASVLLWFPYVLTLPAVFVLALLWPRLTGLAAARSWRAQLPLLLGSAATAGLLVLAGYTAVLVHMHFYSPAGVKAWIAHSRHGAVPTKRLLRFGSGLPRSFLFMGDDTLAFKRFLFKDPYAPTSLLQLIGASLWKVFLFYVFAAALAWALLKSSLGRTFAIALAAAAVPVFVFAVFLFEPGSPERYLQLYPFLALAIACSIAGVGKMRPAHFVIGAFAIIAIATNQLSLSRGRSEARFAKAAERARALKGKVSEDGLVVVVTQHDDLFDFSMTDVFHPANRGTVFPFYDVVPFGSVDLPRWKSEFARQSLSPLENGEAVWISKRLLVDRPRPEWNWTEGDDPRVSWKDLPAFFRQLEQAESIGGEDGFFKLAPSAANRTLLRQQLG